MHEVRIHMEYEEKTVFKYVNNLLSGKSSEDYKITTYSEHHDLVSLKLKELKNIILKYCPEDANTNLLNDALYDIYRCEEELSSHCHIEDCLLVLKQSCVWNATATNRNTHPIRFHHKMRREGNLHIIIAEISPVLSAGFSHCLRRLPGMQVNIMEVKSPSGSCRLCTFKYPGHNSGESHFWRYLQPRAFPC